MHRSIRESIDVHVRKQHGHVTRRQLIAAGMHPSTIWRHAAGGLLIPVGRNTFRLSSAVETRRGAVLAACLDAGGIASHRTAAWLHGFGPAPSMVELTVLKGRSMTGPATMNSRRRQVRIHSTTSLPAADVIHLTFIPTTSVARTTLGLAALVPKEINRRALFDQVSKAVDERLASDPWLWWLLTQRRCRGRNGSAN